MKSSAKLTGSAPILLVSDVSRSIEHYRDKLGFDVVNTFEEPPTFAIMQRDNMFIMFAGAKAECIIPNWKIRKATSNVYFWTDDVESLYKEYIENGATIDWNLYTAPYGVKEFGINDPDSYDIAFGQVIK
mgnify:CR=1 FL=1